MPGALIVFEGIDGAGKSTQQKRLAAALQQAGHEVVQSAEPYLGAPAGRRLRALARGQARPAAPAELAAAGAEIPPGAPAEGPAREEAALFVAQRRAHVRELISPALARGALVLNDRYYLSTVAYQGARGGAWQKLLAFHENDGGFPQPALALWLDVDAAAGMRRVRGRAGVAEPAFEQRAQLERVRAVYAAAAEHCPYLVRVAADAPPAEVAQRIRAEVQKRLHL